MEFSSINAGRLYARRRFSLPRRTIRALLIAYATTVWLLAWAPWNIILLALVAAWQPCD
jgi:hypothetical protein